MTTRTQFAYAATGLVLIAGLIGLFNPVVVAGLLGFELASARSIAEVRATYGALHVTLAALLLWSIPLRPRHGLAVRVLGLLWVGAAAGRLAGFLIDGVVTPVNFVLLIVQLAVGAALVWASFEVPPAPAEVRARREVAAAKERVARAQATAAPSSTPAPRQPGAGRAPAAGDASDASRVPDADDVARRRDRT